MRYDDDNPFWTQVRREPDGCWRWTGPVEDNGQVRVLVGGLHRRVEPERWAWHLSLGGLDDDIALHRRCDTAGCLAPEHHQLVHRADNTPVQVLGRGSDGTLIVAHRCLDHLDQISVAPPRWECLRCGRILDSLDLADGRRP